MDKKKKSNASKKGPRMDPKTNNTLPSEKHKTQAVKERWDETQGTTRSIRTFRPCCYYSPMHKTTAAHRKCVMTKSNVINGGKFQMKVNGNKSSNLYVTCSEEVSSMFPGMCLTQKELAVADGVYTQIKGAELRKVPPYMTTKMIYEAMPGNGTDPSRTQLEKIDEIMNKLWNLQVTYEANPVEIKAPDGQKFLKLTDRFFAYRLLDGIDQCGHPVQYYDFEGRKPIMLDIAEKTKEVLFIPAEYVQIGKDNGRMNDIRIHIVRYLAQRIGHMENMNKKHKLSENDTHIILDSIYAFVGCEDATKDRKKLMRNWVIKCLDYWKMCGWIDGYVLLDEKNEVIPAGQTQGRRIRGMAVIPSGGVKPKNQAKKRTIH